MKPPKLPIHSSPSTQAWLACAGVVYFIAVGQQPYIAIKIGIAAQTGEKDLRTSVKRRLDQIQSANHEPIELIGLKYFPNEEFEFPMWQADALERELHNEFQHLARFARDTRGSEWFTSSPELLERIESIARPPDQFDLPRFFCQPLAGTPVKS